MCKEYDQWAEPEGLVQYCRERFGVEPQLDHAAVWVNYIQDARGHWWLNDSAECAISWLRNRLREYGYFNVPHVDPTDIYLTVELHFWPWEGVKPWNNSDAVWTVSDWPTTVRRSPLSRMGEFEPINKVARRLISSNSKYCPYCNKWFRNPNAAVVHIAEQHPDACEAILIGSDFLPC